MKKLIFILFCGSVNAFGQETISLPEAINTALKNSLDIQVSKN